MTCQACGCQQIAGAQYCRQCGVRMINPNGFQQGVYAPMPGTRVQQNLQALGVAWMVYGGFYLVATLIGGFVFHSFWHSGLFGEMPQPAHALVGTLLPIIATLVVAMASLEIFAGYSLLHAKPFARTFTMVLAILALLKFPLGTALGIYTLWVLAPRSSCAEWRELQES